jgi:uncharacterized protein (TIGR00255 family)
MIQSMTAFARRDATTQWGELAWELRSVNHRYLDTNVRLPETFRPLEPQVRERVSGRLKRGKIDCTLYFRPGEEAAAELELDEQLVQAIVQAAHRVEVLAHNISGLRTADLLRWPGVIRATEPDTESLHRAALDLLAGALDDLVETRRREGAQIREVIAQRLEAMTAQVAAVREVLPEITVNFRARLDERLGQMRDQVDPARLEQEVVLFLQKTDVHEELDRLDAHIAEVGRLLDADEPVGRRLDFLMQELNREANTLGSKAPDLRLTNASVELKVLIEQVREQVQNIE